MKIKKFYFSVLVFTIISMLGFTPVSESQGFTDAVQIILDGLTTTRGEQLTNFDVNSVREMTAQKEVDKWDKKISDLDPDLQYAIYTYNIYQDALTKAENQKMHAEYLIQYASDMIDAICSGESGGSPSDPALQYFLDVRDQAREDLKAAEAEISKQSSNVKEQGKEVDRLEKEMKNLEKNRAPHAHNVKTYYHRKENARTKFNELTEDIWDIYRSHGVPIPADLKKL